MSIVDGITLICSCGEGKPEAISARLFQACGEWFADVTDHYGGDKHPQQYIFGAGINHFARREDLVAFVQSHAWSCPENVVLIIEPEDGQTMTWRPHGWQEAASPTEVTALRAALEHAVQTCGECGGGDGPFGPVDGLTECPQCGPWRTLLAQKA